MRLLITGASGQLGGYLLRALSGRRHDIFAWSGSRPMELFDVRLRPVDLASIDAVTEAFADARPNFVIHLAAMTTMAGCNREPTQAIRINSEATQALGDLCKAAGAGLLFTSTDLVFDGLQGNYRETDVATPLSQYGRTKLDAEKSVLSCPNSIVVRTSLMFGPSLVGRPSFFDDQVTALRERKQITLFADEWRTPLSLETAARALLKLVESDFTGLLHLGGPERMSRFDMGRRLALYLRADESTLVAALRADSPSSEPRPRDVSLDSSEWRQHFAGAEWPTWNEALEQLFGICRS